jgi:hypothetical protein
MRGFAHASLLVGLASLAQTEAFANTHGVYLPPAPRGPGGEDSIQTATGSTCRQSINSNGAYLDMGAAANANAQWEDSTSNIASYYNRDPERSGLVYVRLTIPLGKRPVRIDCSRLYELELARLRSELELLKMAAE